MPSRVVGLDLGSRRIGVASSDSTGTIASPHSVLERQHTREADHAAVARLVADLGAERVVVGLPLSLDDLSPEITEEGNSALKKRR